MPFSIIKDDIVRLDVDAIVNAANTELLEGGGVCGAIFAAAGAGKLQAECDKLSPIRTGEAVITGGYKLRAKHIIHTAGPVYNRYSKDEADRLLAASYTNSLELAKKNKLESIAFPLISAGIYGFPPSEAMKVASGAIREFLEENDMDVRLIVRVKEAFEDDALHNELEEYICAEGFDGEWDDYHAGIAKRKAMYNRPLMGAHKASAPAADFMCQNVACDMEPLDEPFSVILLRLIDAKGMTDPEVYKRANMDRRLFSKIRSDSHYVPSKKTVLALSIALRLSIGETEDLLERAGFALSRSLLFDTIVRFFIERGEYDIFKINEELFRKDQSVF